MPAALRFAHGVGPASPFYVPPEVHSRTPRYTELYYSTSCRSEIMSAFSEMLLLEEDALFRAWSENRPFRDFKDQAKAIKAEQLYMAGSSPYADLSSCAISCSFKWQTIIQSLM